MSALALGLSPSVASAAPTNSAGNLASLFNTYGDTSGRWAGGDGTASVPLPDGRVAWLFSDSLVGPVNADHSVPSTVGFVDNSIVVESATGQLVSTLTGGTAGAPTAWLPPPAANQAYFVADATVAGSQLHALYNLYQRGSGGSLDLTLQGTALAVFTLPALTLSSVTTLPLNASVAWGSAILNDGGYTYIYGTELGNGSALNFAHLARVPQNGLAGAWQFWTGTGWSADQTTSARLLSGVGAAFGVEKIGAQYVLVTEDTQLPFNPDIVAYTSPAPTGPFTGPTYLYTAPEPAADPGKPLIVYDARVHPELAAAGRLLFSYNVNSLNSTDVYSDVRNYRPRFVDLAWPIAAPNPDSLPSAPTGLSATADLEGVVHLAWHAPAGLSFNAYQRDVTAGATAFVRSATQITANTADLSQVLNGHAYEFKVTAVNSNGEGPATTIATATATVSAPPAPTGVSATVDIAGQATVSWQAVAGVWGYDVRRRDVTAGETAFTRVASVGPSQTTANAGYLNDNETYEFQVTAKNGAGSSPPSTPVRVTAHLSVPPAPTGLTATANDDGTITLAWTAPLPGLWYWVYQRDVTAGEATFTRLPLPVSTGTTMTAGYLQDTHTYEYQVSAVNRVGEGPRSLPASATSGHAAPAPPTGLGATVGDGTVTLTWTASATANVWYWVYMRDVTAGETTFTKTAWPVTTCCTTTMGMLANAHTYDFKITAIAGTRESVFSSTVLATPNVAAPVAVTGLTAVAQGDGSVTLSWTGPTGASLWYIVYQRDVTAGEANFIKLALPVTKCCTANVGKKMNVNTHTYEYRVAAANGGGEGPQSAAVQAIIRYDLPAAPTNLRGATSGDGYIRLDWDAPPTYFWVYYRDVTAGTTTFTKSALPYSTNYATVGPLVDGHSYEFQVTATSPAGEGPASTPVRVTSAGGLPLAPSALTATPGDGKVTLSWTASPTASVMYWVYLRDTTTGQSWQKLSLPVSTCCSQVVQPLTNGDLYEFKVTATNASGDSAPSNVASAKPLPPIPQPPTGLTATAGNGSVALSWTASTTTPVWYWVEYKPNGGSWQRIATPITNCCSTTVSYLTNLTSYQFRLFSVNLAGTSTSSSNVTSATPVPPKPAAPTNLAATTSSGTVTLTWTASTTPGVYYWIEFKTNTATQWTRATYPVTTCCSFVAKNLTNGVPYTFRLIATNGLESGPSNLVTVTPWVSMGSRPVINASPNGRTTTYLWWSATANASGYWVEYMNLSAGDVTWSRAQYPVLGTNLNAAYLGQGSWYRWRVVPFNGAQEGSPSTPIEARTQGSTYYAALNVMGDSYSAGLGSGSEVGACKRSPYAWGLWIQVAKATTVHQACSGDTTVEVRANQMPQIAGGTRASIITITIGGNDVGFAESLKGCVTGSCTGQEATLSSKIAAMRQPLISLYRQLRVSAPGADIIVAGYPLLVVPASQGTCSNIAQTLSPEERRMIRRLAAQLDQVIEDAAATAGVLDAVSETLDQFAGHEACSRNTEYINQVTWNDLKTYITDSSFHPNGVGQGAYTDAVNTRLNYLQTEGMTRSSL